jgi:hypothetical protein
VQRFFEEPTVASLARLAGGAVDGNATEPAPERGPAPTAATLEPLPRERYRVRLTGDAVELPDVLREWKARAEG